MLAGYLYQTACVLRARNIGYTEGRLKNLPTVSVGHRMRQGKEIRVIREYSHESGSRKRKQYDFDSPKGKALLDLLEMRKKLEMRRQGMKWVKQLEKRGRGVIYDEEINIPSKFSKAVFDRLIERNDPSIAKDFCFDGRRFRSKSEVNIAQFLKSMGLEYKYEVKITIDGQVFYIDFAVYCPETGRFFFIEHFGKMSEERYRMRVFNKLTAYSTCGLQEGSDILYTFENADVGYNIDILQGKIVGVIATHMALAKQQG